MNTGYLSTIGFDGKEYFWEYVFCEVMVFGINKIEFRLNLAGDNDGDNWFDFKLLPVDDITLKVTDMFSGKDEHLRKGLPEALIILARKIFGKSIISSTNFEDYKISNREWRSEKATKVWQRLEKKGFAIYDSHKDLYILNNELES